MSKDDDDVVVQNSTDLFRVAGEVLKEVKVIHVSSNEIQQCFEKSVPWQGVQDVRGISKIHAITTEDGSVLKLYKRSADQEVSATVKYADVTHVPKGLGKVGDWVVVRYDGEIFPGEIIDIKEQGKCL